ncbi:MAG: efflux RND transporter permease subunit [Rhodocyclaceae bacterium]|nr:efflux RND transporter permease subunit [Rhodocyclaceae bacterium]
MDITAFAVKRFQFTLVMFLLLVAMGWHSLQNIPRAEDPVFPIPVVIVNVVYPGADPEDMERLVVDPLEDALNLTSNVKEIRSFAGDGMAQVSVEYDWTKDAEKQYDEAIRELNTARTRLPADLALFEIEKANPGTVNILFLALIGPNSAARELRETAENLQDRLEQAFGVRAVDVSGLPRPQVQIALDLPKLARFNIPLTQVIDTLKGENALVPGGAVEVGVRRFNVRTSGSYESLEEIADTVVASTGGAAQGGGRIVRLRDVASVTWDYEEANYLTRYNGQRAIFIGISQKDAMNIFKVREGLIKEIDAFRANLSPDMRLELGFDQSENVDKRLKRLGFDLMLAVGLVLITLLPLGLRAAAVVMVSIPLSMAIGIFLLDISGFSLNQLSIAGFVLALGLLVDDSIVVTENIERFLRMGYTRAEAAVAATKQITMAVLGCTATLLFAFLPLFMLPEGAGKFIKSLAASVNFTIIASLLVSLTVIPFLASRVLSEKEAHGNRMLQLVMGGIQAFYRPLLHRALTWPKATTALAGLLFGAVLVLIPGIGFSLFPQADVPQFMITIDMPEGSSVQATDGAVKFVENVLSTHDEVKYMFANVGRGNPRVYYNVFRRGTRASVGEVYVGLQSFDPRTTPAFLDRLRDELANYPEARIVLKRFENGPPLAAPIAIRVFGDDLDTLTEVAGKVEAVIKSVEGTRDVNNPLRLARTDLDLGIDTTKASLYGVPTLSIDRTVRLAVAGEIIGQLREPDGDERAIVVRAPMKNGYPQLDVLDDVYVNNVAGNALPLRQFIDPKLSAATNSISRFKRQRVVTVTAEVVSGYNTEKLTNVIIAKLGEVKLPPGYRFAISGEREAREASFGGLATAGLIALFGIFAVLVLEFGDFRSTVIVAGVIPLGIIGGVLALFLSGYNLSFMAVIGFIALIGIEIKNSILLVDFTHQLRDEGMGLREAIEQAGEIRFFPILLTSLTAIGGLMPLALQGSPLYSPLAWVIIGGLVSSTFLSRLVTPAMYFLLAPKMAAKA